MLIKVIQQEANKDIILSVSFHSCPLSNLLPPAAMVILLKHKPDHVILQLGSEVPFHCPGNMPQPLQLPVPNPLLSLLTWTHLPSLCPALGLCNLCSCALMPFLLPWLVPFHPSDLSLSVTS